MSYVDGFVLPIAKDKIDQYRKISEDAGKIWMEYGALAYKELQVDDDNIFEMRSFADTAGAKDGETVIFAFILYKSREHRDEVNAKVMADPRINCETGEMPFDVGRMAYAGFKSFVDF